MVDASLASAVRERFKCRDAKSIDASDVDNAGRISS